MFPEQPYYAPSAPQPPTGSGQPQYDFIVHTGNNHSSNILTRLLGGSLKMHIIVAAGGAGVLLIIVLLLGAVLSSGNSSNVAALTAIAQKQTELARISTDPSRNASQQTTKDFAASLSLTLLSDQQATVSFLAGRGTNLNTNALARNKNPATDAALQTALSNGTYDSAYTSIAQSQLTAYEKALQGAALNTQSKSELQLLSAAYAHAQLLLEQSNAH